MFQKRFDCGAISLLYFLRAAVASWRPRFPDVTNGPWGIGGELSSREAKPKPARVMELELPHKTRVSASTSDLAGF